MSGPVGNNPYRASGVVAVAAAGLSWCSAIKTGAFCAQAGNGYFINTCGGTFEVTLPAAAAVGDEINFTDYARTWGVACKALTLNQNSLNFQGNTSPKPEYDTEGATVRIVYADATKGWIPQLDKGTEMETPPTYPVQYMVIGGGGGGGWGRSGGGGAGGSRTVASIPAGLTVDPATPIAITVGAGGAATPGGGSGPGGFSYGYHGVDSVFSTITSAGGGGGSYNGAPYPPAQATAINGGSGGGGAYHGPGTSPASAGGTGNTPPTPCTQGFAGGAGTPVGGPGPAGARAGGGGGGGAAIGAAGGPSGGGKGGLGDTTAIFGSTPTAPSYGTCGPAPGRYFAGGGGGGVESGTVGPVPDGGGGGAGGTTGAAGSGTVNTGGAGGGVGEGASTGGAGGSGVVIIRRVTACSCSTSGTVVTDGSDTIHIFTGDGTFAP